MPTGSGSAQIFYDPTQASNLNDVTLRFDPGYEVDFQGKRFVYVKHNKGTGSIATAAGAAAYWSDVANGVATADKSDGQQGGTAGAHGAMCAGVYQAVVTDGYGTWLQKRGVMAGVLLASGDTNGLAGNKIFPPVTNVDSTFRSEALDSISAEEISAQVVGYQVGAGASNTATVFLQII